MNRDITYLSFDMRESLLSKKDFGTMYSKLKEFNNMPEKEQVLVFPRSTLEALGSFVGFRKEAPPSTISSCAFLQSPALLSSLFYMDRDLAEKNENFLQLIPYCVFKCGKNFLVYQRTKKGGESRLHDKWSLGVGGHINDSDGEITTSYESGMLRELSEEVDFKIPAYYELSYYDVKNVPTYTNQVLGFIYDDSNEVGRVHFGVVHLIEVNNDIILNFRDEALDKGSWVYYDWLVENSEKFENWSQLVIEHLK